VAQAFEAGVLLNAPQPDALRFMPAPNVTRAANAVSVKHGEVTRAMFHGREIGSITNGVHHPTWTGPYASALYDRSLPGWRERGEQLRAADGLGAADPGPGVGTAGGWMPLAMISEGVISLVPSQAVPPQVLR